LDNFTESMSLELHGIRKGMGKGSFPLSLHTAYVQHVQHTMLQCLETRAKNAVLYKKWLDMNEKLAYSKTMNCTCKPQVRYLAKYLEKVRNAWLNKSRKCNTLLSEYPQPFLPPICFTSFCCTTPCQFTPLTTHCLSASTLMK